MELKTVGELKKSAYNHLGDCWGECAAIFFMVCGVCTAIAAAFALAMLFIDGTAKPEQLFKNRSLEFYALCGGILLIIALISIPFKYGISWYLLQQVRGNAVPLSCIFSCYTSQKRLIQTIALEIGTLLRKSVVGIPLVGFGIVEIRVAAAALRNIESKLIFTVIAAVLVLLLACMTALYLVFAMRFFLVPYIFASDSDKKISEIISESEKIMYGKELYLAELYFSFSGMSLFCLLIFPAIFFIPFIRMTTAAAAAEIIDNYSYERKNLDEFLKKTVE